MREAARSRSWRRSFGRLGHTQPNDPAYELFIGFLTIVALVDVALVFVIRAAQVEDILTGVDALLCLIFIGDTARSWWHAEDRRAYMFGVRPGRSMPTGLVDLIGSIPSLLLLRLLRIPRLTRVRRDLRGREPGELIQTLVDRRAEVAAYIVATSAILVMLIGSSLVAFIEPAAPNSNIKSGGDAFWWAFVTITTVGYGDRYPVTGGGRIVGMLTMAVGIGIFSVLTSYLAQLFLRRPERHLKSRASTAAPDATVTAEPERAPVIGGIHGFAMEDTGLAVEPIAEPVVEPGPDDAGAELRAMRAELAELRQLVESRLPGPTS